MRLGSRSLVDPRGGAGLAASPPPPGEIITSSLLTVRIRFNYAFHQQACVCRCTAACRCALIRLLPTRILCGGLDVAIVSSLRTVCDRHRCQSCRLPLSLSTLLSNPPSLLWSEGLWLEYLIGISFCEQRAALHVALNSPQPTICSCAP